MPTAIAGRIEEEVKSPYSWRKIGVNRFGYTVLQRRLKNGSKQEGYYLQNGKFVTI